MPRNTIEQLETDFAKADAEHTANSVKLQESANKREALRKQLEEAREGGTEVVEADPEQVDLRHRTVEGVSE